MQAIRGAITAQADRPEEIRRVVEKLMKRVISANSIKANNIVSVIFSSTADIKSLYPAQAFREMGYDFIPIFSCQEPEISGSLELCIRVLVHLKENVHETARESQKNVRHIYLEGARKLRPDLVEENLDG